MIDYNKLLSSIAAKRTRDNFQEKKLFTQEAFDQVIPKNYQFTDSEAYFIVKILVQAALSGWFRPAELLPLSANEDAKLMLLQQLYRHCTTNNKQPQSWWLEKDVRVSILGNLINQKQLEGALRDRLPQPDHVGSCIQEILTNGNIDLSGKTNEELLNYSQALEAIDGLMINKPDLHQLRLRIEKNNFLLQQGILNNNIFIGRDTELNELHSFIYEDAMRNEVEWFGLILNGEGGAGKSALLNKFHTELFHAGDVATALIDFDRPGMDPQDTLWLETEIVKQIQLQFNMIFDLDAQWTKVWSSKLSNLSSSGETELESRKRSYRSFLYSFKDQYIQNRRKKNNTWILILDTFEEVVQRGLTETISDWIAELESLLDPIKLKVIFSGRLFQIPDQLHVPGLMRGMLKLGEFDSKSCEQFLIQLKVQPDVIKRILRNKLIPKQPLQLKLLAQLFLQEGAEGVRKLENELANGEKNTTLYTGTIYKRVLLRLHRKELRMMAYPGLILRYLTADLIQNVLSPVLGLENINKVEANRILQDLAKYGWLAYMSGDKLWHRKDLRRAILQVMVANDPEVAKNLHIAAINYYAQNFSESNTIEMIYHQFMIGDFEEMPSYEKEISLKSIEAQLQGDLFDFPKKSRVVFDLLWRQIIIRQNLDLLPTRYQQLAFEILGKNYIEREQFRSAFILLKSLRSKYFLDPAPQIEGNINWQLEAMFQTVNWHLVPLDSDQLASHDVLGNITITLLRILPKKADVQSAMQIFKQYLTSSELIYQLERGYFRLHDLIGRLAVCLMLMRSKGLAAEQISGPIAAITHFLRQSTAKYRPPEIYRVMLLLELCSGKRQFPNYLMTTSFGKLDTEWLNKRINYTLSSQVNDTLGGMIEIINEFNRHTNLWDPQKSHRMILSAIDRGHRGKQAYDSAYPTIDVKTTFDDIKGPFPEIRNLVKYALLSEFRGFDGFNDLYTILLNIINKGINHTNSGEIFELFRRKADRELSLYVELIDRMWKTQELLEAALHLRPRSVKLNSVYQLCSTWYGSYRQAWEEAGEK